MPKLSARGRTRALVFSFGTAAVLVSGTVTGGLFAQTRQRLSLPSSQPTAAAIAPLVETQNAFAAVAAQVTPAVVSIHVEGSRPASQGAMPDMQGLPEIPGFPFGRGRRQSDRGGQQPEQIVQGSGSGFIVSKDGFILTNNHVVADARKVTVILPDRREFIARVVGRDPTTDVAVIKIDAENLPTLALGNDEITRVGDWVLAIGNPLGLDFTVTQGIVSAKGRGGFAGLYQSAYAVVDYIQTDAPINPGNSGGPLVNVKGEVVGINSAIASPTGSYAGYGFAIPVTLARDVMQQLVAYGHVRRGIMGLALQEVRQKDAETAELTKAGVKQIRGALVGDFPNGKSSARAAGVEKGDVIVAANGHDIDHVASLQRLVRAEKPGDTVTLTVVRHGVQHEIRVRLDEAPQDDGVVAEK